MDQMDNKRVQETDAQVYSNLLEDPSACNGSWQVLLWTGGIVIEVEAELMHANNVEMFSFRKYYNLKQVKEILAVKCKRRRFEWDALETLFTSINKLISNLR